MVDAAVGVLHLAEADPRRSVAPAARIARQSRRLGDLQAASIAERALGIAALHLQDSDLAEAEATVDLMAQFGEQDELSRRIRQLMSSIPGRHDESVLRVRECIDRGVGTIEHNIRTITAPVRDGDGRIALCLTLRMPDGPQSAAYLQKCVKRLLGTAFDISTAIAEHVHGPLAVDHTR